MLELSVEEEEAVAAYLEQLEMLGDMGFTDFDSNVRALIATRGDVQSAVSRLTE